MAMADKAIPETKEEKARRQGTVLYFDGNDKVFADPMVLEWRRVHAERRLGLTLAGLLVGVAEPIPDGEGVDPKAVADAIEARDAAGEKLVALSHEIFETTPFGPDGSGVLAEEAAQNVADLVTYLMTPREPASIHVGAVAKSEG